MLILLQNSFYVAAILVSWTHPTIAACGARATGLLEELAQLLQRKGTVEGDVE